MKQKIRFDGIDVAAMTAQMRSTLLGHKLANVYDGAAVCTSTVGADGNSGKSTFLFKLANPSTSAPAVASNGLTKSDNESQKIEDSQSTVKSESNPPTTDAPGTVSTSSTGSHHRISMLLIESGVRFHTTNYYTVSDNATLPSPFAMKLRKHLRNLRLENVTQLGNMDRVVDFRFGLGDRSHHVILELYGMGNIILTDSRYVILALLRVHEYAVGRDVGKEDGHDETRGGADDRKGDVKVRVGNVYPVTYATTMGRPSDGSSNEDHVGSRGRNLLDMTDGEQAYQWTKGELHAFLETQILQSKVSKPSTKKKKKEKDGSITLKTLLLKPSSGVFHYGPSLIEHCVLFAGLDPATQLTLDKLEQVMPPTRWDSLLNSLWMEGSRIISDFTSSETKGYVLYRNRPTSQVDSSKTSDWVKNMPHSDKVFEEFQPHLLRQHTDRPTLVYDTFSQAVDEFYSLLEGQKRAMRAEAAEQTALLKLEKIRKDQEKRMEGLEIEMNKVKEHARLVEIHADDVDKAIGVINSALDSGMDWNSLEELVEVEKGNMNPIALLIKKLNLDKDEVVLSLPDSMNWDQNSGEVPLIVDVSVSLKESAFGNARKMYDQYRNSKDKAEKTAEASEKALKAAEANAQRQIEQAQKKKNLTYSLLTQPQRKPHWFEKFLWFITSDNYLCIGGRDAQQNEQLVKRYLRPGDAYLHADIHGAPTCILRAKRRRNASGATEVLPLSEQALREAGTFAICRSSAWSSRIVTSAWWVESHQVSKTAPTGEYLTVGSFMIRGKKNFLPPSQLEMGIAILFRLGDDASIVRHKNERRDFSIMALEEETDQDDLTERKSTTITTTTTNATTSHPRDSNYNNVQASVAEVESTDMIDEVQDTRTSKLIETKSNGGDVGNPPSMIPEEENINANVLPSKSGEDDMNDDSSKPKKKSGLSAKDRKLMKKYGSLEAAQEALAKIRAQEEEIRKSKHAINSEKATTNQIEKNAASNNTRNVRGKKSKLKKISKKYADQDEEDRELALLVLQGSTKEKKKKGGRNVQAESTSQIKAAAETVALLVRDASEVIDKVPPPVREYLAKAVTVNDQVRWDKLEAEVLEQLLSLDEMEVQEAVAKRLLQLCETSRMDNFSSSLAGIIRTAQKYGHQGLMDVTPTATSNNMNDGITSKHRGRKTKEQKEAEKQSWREILSQDGALEDNENVNDDAVDDTSEISKLTSKPLPEDVILHAVPVCAPYSTLSQYKYRIKLVPGNMKRGKASKQCLEIFLQNHNAKSGKGKDALNNDSINDRYVDMIKAINDNEWVQAICGDVKISSAGASKVMKKSKATKKKKADK